MTLRKDEWVLRRIASGMRVGGKVCLAVVLTGVSPLVTRVDENAREGIYDN